MASHEIMNITSLAQHLDHHHHDHDHDESDDHDALSFCDLMMDSSEESDLPTSEESYDDDDQEEDELFEFLTSPEAENSRTDKIVFCGKTITPRKQPEDDDGGSDVRYPRKGLIVVRRRESFKKSHSSGASRSSSFRFGGLGGAKAAAALPVETGGYYRSSSGGGGGSGSRKQKVFIGLVMRLEPKMELSEIRKRQGRRSPAPLFPATGSAAGGRGGRSSGSCRHNWGSLWCRAHFVSALTKASFGCISH